MAAIAPLSRAVRSKLTSRSDLATASYQLINNLAEGTTSETAYDTAVVSALRSSRDYRRPLFPATLLWLQRHQHNDGSWGGRIAVAHDRLVSTLAVVVRLEAIPAAWAQQALQRGLAYLWQHASDWLSSSQETVAFELLVPRCLDEARSRGLQLPYTAFTRIIDLRDDKLRRMPMEALYNKPTTFVHSLEFLGPDLDRVQVTRLRSANGAYGNSPSATAYVLGMLDDPAAESYLRRAMAVSLNGGACTVYPNEIFEKGWVLYNLGPDGIRLRGAQQHLDYLYQHSLTGATGISREGLTADSDDTGMALALLNRSGRPLSLAGLCQFEREDCFSCFPYERNSSISANAHVLEAFVSSPYRHQHTSAIQKIVAYLRDMRLDGCYWQDKWHISPLYATSQVVLAARDVATDLVAPTIRWLLGSQHSDGSWGCAGGTSEETAYALQTLIVAEHLQDSRMQSALEAGASYLSQHFDDMDYPELWIGKGLYTPYAVVRAAVIGALQQYRAMIELP
ncbi:MAG: hypothetical protein ACR2HB_17150 [Dehalococcoidia bacterium]